MPASTTDYGSCRRCRAVVLWVVLPSGKTMPVDPTPDPAGTVAVMRDPALGYVGRVVTTAVPARHFEHLHTTHFATCAPTVAHRQGLRDGTVVDLQRARQSRSS